MGTVIPIAFGHAKAEALWAQADAIDDDPARAAEAMALYQQALHFNPKHARAMVNLGNLYWKQDNRAAARGLYAMALENDPNLPEAHYNLGYDALERHEPGIAIPYFVSAVALDAQFADAYFNLAEAYVLTGQTVRSLSCWKRFLTLSNDAEYCEFARERIAEIERERPTVGKIRKGERR